MNDEDDDEDDDDEDDDDEDRKKKVNSVNPVKAIPNPKPIQLKSLPKTSSSDAPPTLVKVVTAPSQSRSSENVTTSDNKSSERKRGNTITRRELAEHERL
ncbi:unnamed protein product, partial [Candida parapsilosis]